MALGTGWSLPLEGGRGGLLEFQVVYASRRHLGAEGVTVSKAWLPEGFRVFLPRRVRRGLVLQSQAGLGSGDSCPGVLGEVHHGPQQAWASSIPAGAQEGQFTPRAGLSSARAPQPCSFRQGQCY